MLRRVKEWQIDLFAVPISLTHEGKKKANSRHGIFLTVLFAGFLIWSVYNLGHELFAKRNPNTINYDSFVETPIPMELNKNSFPFAFGLQLPIMQGLNFFKDEKIYKPDVKLVVFNIDKASDGTVTKTRDLIDIDVEPCRLEHFGDAWPGFTELPLELLYCIKPNQSRLEKIIIKGITDYTDSQAFNLAIVKCQNTTTDFSCKTDDEIEYKLTGAWLSIFYTQSAINPQNFTHPNQRFRTTFVSMVSPNLYKSAITKLNHLNVISDDGWLFETKKVQNYVKMNAPTEYLDLTPSDFGFLWNGVFEISQVVTTYERKYTKLQTVLAQIQGSAATVILILVIVLHPYSQVKFNETLINELFDVKIKKRDGKEKKKKGKGVKKNKNREESSKMQKQERSENKTPVVNNEIELNSPQNIDTERMKSERALLSTMNKYEDEQSPDKIVPTNKQGTLQSFKTLLFSIESETESPAGIPYYQKPPQTLIEQGKSQEISARKFTKGAHLTVDRPVKINLQGLSDIASEDRSSPRKVYEYDSREENDESSFERDRKTVQEKKKNKGMHLQVDKREKINLQASSDIASEDRSGRSGPGKIYEYESSDEEERKEDHPEDIMATPLSPQSGLLDQDNEKQNDGIVSVEMIDFEDGKNNEDDDDDDDGKEPSLQIEGVEGHTKGEDSTAFESSKIDISIWEFFLSYIKKTEKTTEKFEVLNKGMKNVRERMDLLNIMKKFREFDKLKALLLEEDQLILFNAIPKAEIKASGSAAVSTIISTGDLMKSKTVSGRMLKKSTFIDLNEKQEQVRKSYDNLQVKPKKSKIDVRLLEIYNELLLNRKE